MSHWVWVEVPPTGGADASTGAGIFKNWGDTSELLAREVIQNSWDAAQGYREDDPSHDFEVVFQFDDLDGDRKSQFVDGLDLRQLFEQRVHLRREESRARLEESALGRLDDDEPLSVLYISDYGAHGLYGAPALRRESHLYKALYTLGVTGKDDAGLTSGGSYGFGKGAFIRASRMGTVVAYSSFEPRPEAPYEDATTRRLIGWTFWSGHEADGVERDGRAWFGAVGSPGSAEPYADDEADRVASLLGMPPAPPANGANWGQLFSSLIRQFMRTRCARLSRGTGGQRSSMSTASRPTSSLLTGPSSTLARSRDLTLDRS